MTTPLGCAVKAKDFWNAGWRAYNVGWIYYLRGQPIAVIACAERAEEHWRKAQTGMREKATAISLRGLGFEMVEDYELAIPAYREVVELLYTLSRESQDVSTGLSHLADARARSGDLDGAEQDYREALRIARALGYHHGIANDPPRRSRSRRSPEHAR